MVEWVPDPVAVQAGTLLWERNGIACQLVRHASRTWFEIRLVGPDGLVTQEFFGREVDAALYALNQMRALSTPDAV